LRLDFAVAAPAYAATNNATDASAKTMQAEPKTNQ
jgi:hypothetical protein